MTTSTAIQVDGTAVAAFHATAIWSLPTGQKNVVVVKRAPSRHPGSKIRSYAQKQPRLTRAQMLPFLS